MSLSVGRLKLMGEIIDFNEAVGLRAGGSPDYSDLIRRCAAAELIHVNEVSPDDLSSAVVTAYLQGAESILVKMSTWFEEHLPMLKPERLDWFVYLDDFGDLQLGFMEAEEDPEEDVDCD